MFSADWMVKDLMHGASKRLHKEWIICVTLDK